MNTPLNNCTECGAELDAGAVRGLCARCLLQAGLGSQTDPNATVVAAGGAGQQRVLPNAGELFGPYRIIRLLGRGGMGVVYEAEEQETGRRVALKVLARQFDSSKDRARFLREGRMAASINHPNSVYVFGTEEINGTPTIAMELVSGGTLQERLKERGPMSVPAAVDAILQIIAGLEAAQAIGILHRDVKPGNCFEDADGTIKIGDFGLSISTDARAENSITAAGTLVGTPAFCSPEQLRGEELSARADMYSVGGTLFFLLTGRVPFEGHNIVQLTANVLEKPVPSPRDLRKEIPRGLAGVIQRCLAKQPADRFKSYGDLCRALAPYGSTAPSPATLSLRFLAGMLDMFVLTAVSQVVLISFVGNPMDALKFMYESPAKAWLFMLGSFSFMLLYYAIFEGLWGAAAGKAICRLRVVRPDKNPPGFSRALLRALIYVVLPVLPAWIVYGADPRAMIESPGIFQQLIGFSFYFVLAFMFCTARRRNGFAAVQDLATKTRVVSRAALEMRPVLSAVETPPLDVDAKPAVGPYHVLEALETCDDGQWLLGYDLRLLRKVWIRTVPSGTPPVASPLRNIGRVGRLRWLTGQRSAEENWDAFEGVSGKPLLKLIATRQPWSQVRFWLYDLARELSAAEKDGTLPRVLSLDRVWITSDGRAKLLDFPAPGAGEAPAAPALPESGRTQRFLGEVAAALEGRTNGAANATGKAAVPLPLHARLFLQKLPLFSDADAVAAALQPLLRRTTSISRWRRAAVVAGCAVVPILMCSFMIIAMSMMQKSCPGILELSQLLQMRRGNAWAEEKQSEAAPQLSSGDEKESEDEEITNMDRQIAVYIASHYRETIANKDVWNNPLTISMIKADDRQFVEQCVADHPAPTEEEIADADAALKPYLDMFKVFESHPLAIMTVMLAFYVCLPACIAALLFRGGLVLRMASITFVRRDGKRASRLRVFWRALVAWSPLWLGLPGVMLFFHIPNTSSELTVALFCGLFLGLAILSVALPKRGLPDRLTGTWPVPR